MFALTTLRHLFDEPLTHAARFSGRTAPVRTGVMSQYVDGWYNPYVDTLTRTLRK